MLQILLVFITMSTVAYAGQPSNIIGDCYTCNLPKPSENWTQRQKQENSVSSSVSLVLVNLVEHGWIIPLDNTLG